MDCQITNLNGYCFNLHSVQLLSSEFSFGSSPLLTAKKLCYFYYLVDSDLFAADYFHTPFV